MKKLTAVLLLVVAAGVMLLPVVATVNGTHSNGTFVADGTGPTPPIPPGQQV